MKKTVLITISTIMLILWLAYPTYAGGDKERGDKGQGCVNQVQEEDPPAFKPKYIDQVP